MSPLKCFETSVEISYSRTIVISTDEKGSEEHLENETGFSASPGV